jgi:hypothetical protein
MSGSFKNLTTSFNSSFASSFPATSSNFTPVSVTTLITLWSKPVKSENGSEGSPEGL